MRVAFVFLFVSMFGGMPSWAQKDTIKLINEDILVGEIEKLDKSVLTFSTAYSDSDFKIEWRKVLEVKSRRTFIIALSDGVRVTGKLSSIEGAEKKLKIEYEDETIEDDLMDVIFLEPIGKNAFSNLSVDVDFGVTLTKANNLRQFNTYIGATYLARKWSANGFIKTVLSIQDDADDITRNEAEVGGQYFLPNDWFVTAKGKYLTNNEQLLDLRSTYQGGLGYYFIHNNSMYFSAMAGMAYTNEIYSNDNPNRNSAEAVLGLGFQKYSIGDLSFLTTAVLYPSLTESGRYRVDLNGDMKYDLPLEFYIKLSVTYNYDSEPTEGATDSDYVFTTSFGWEFN